MLIGWYSAIVLAHCIYRVLGVVSFLRKALVSITANRTLTRMRGESVEIWWTYTSVIIIYSHRYKLIYKLGTNWCPQIRAQQKFIINFTRHRLDQCSLFCVIHRLTGFLRPRWFFGNIFESFSFVQKVSVS